MAPRLSHVPVGHVRSFYESSFRQLSDIQQRQTGLLLGAAIGDAAARPQLGPSQGVLQPRRHAAADTTGQRTESNTAFTRAFETSPQRVEHSKRTSSALAPRLCSHSFSYALFADSVRAMAAAGGDFALPFIQPRWVQTANEVPLDVFAAHHGRLFHTLLAVLPFPVLYPYASDHVLRSHSEPFVDFLTSTGGDDVEAVRTPGAAHIRDYTFSALGVVLRCLQSNPDATRNAAFMAVAGTAPLFPEDVRHFCPVADNETSAERSANDADAPYWLGEEVEVVRQSLIIARESQRFSEGVQRAIALGGPLVTQRTMLVGAMLGARLGVRQLPIDWLNATPDHRTVATLAITIAQQSWNPLHH